MDRAGEGVGVAADVRAVAVQQGAAADDVVDVAARDVPDVGVLGDHAQCRGGASADEDGRVGALDGSGAAEGAGEPVVGAVEVERLVLGPQSPDHRAGFRQVGDGVRGVVEGQTVGVVLAPGQRVAGAGADADAEVQPSAGDDVDGGGDLGQQGRGPEAVAGDHDADAQPPGVGGEGGEQGPALVGGSGGVAEDRHEVVEEPGVLDLGDGVGLAPDAQDVGVVDLRGGGHDAEAE